MCLLNNLNIDRIHKRQQSIITIKHDIKNKNKYKTKTLITIIELYRILLKYPFSIYFCT